MPDPTAMTPEDVPDELIQAFTAAEDVMYDAGESISEESLRIGLAAALPAHEAMVRERIAKDIKAAAPCMPTANCNPYCKDCVRYRQARRDIEIARGKA